MLVLLLKSFKVRMGTTQCEFREKKQIWNLRIRGQRKIEQWGGAQALDLGEHHNFQKTFEIETDQFIRRW